MEIKTCEQYVLAQLRDAHEQIESLESEIESLKKDLEAAANTIERMNRERMGENTESIFT